jgi:diacylglycerol kinase (ATP)
MTSMRLAVIINPVAGRTGGRADGGAVRMEHARLLVDRPDVEAELVLTTASGHGAELARAFVARDFDIVVAWGGDGTVNEIAGPLIATRTALGIVPSGSGDGLARSLGLHADAAGAFAAAMAGTVGGIDVGYLGDRHFLNVGGIGFDAAIADSFNRGARRGGLGYVGRVLQMVWSYAPERYRVILDGQIRDAPAFLLVFANGREYGNHMVIAPDADPTDGWLDMAVADDRAPLHQLWRARRLFFRQHHPVPGLTRTRVRSATVEGARLLCHVDGESFQTSGALQVSITPQALRVRGLSSARSPRANV